MNEYLRLFAYRLPDLDPVGGFTGEIELARSRTFTKELNGTGSGSFIIENEDALSELLEELDYVKIFRSDDMGTAKFGLLLGPSERTELNAERDGEIESELSTKWEGVGPLGALGLAVVDPTLGPNPNATETAETDRTLDWKIYEYDDDGWDDAIDTGIAVRPKGWEDSSADKIWHPDYDDANVWSPPGPYLFRKTFNVADAGWYILDAALDNYGGIWIDSVKVLSLATVARENFALTHHVGIYLTAGDHVVTARVTNQTGDDPEPGNPGTLLLSVARLVGNLDRGTVVVRSNSTGWKTFGTYLQPGVTPGMALRILLEEAQDRGAIPFVTWTFSDTLDSNGDAWDTTSSVSTKVGTDLLSLVGELVGAGRIDVEMSVDFELRVTNAGGIGVDSGVVFAPSPEDDPESGNLEGIVRRRG